MRVRAAAQCVIDLPHAVWDYYPYPRLRWTDFPARGSAWRYDKSDAGIVIEPIIDAVRLREHELPTELLASHRTAPEDITAPTLQVSHSVTPTLVSSNVPGVGKVWEYTLGGQKYLHWYERMTPHTAYAVLCERAEHIPAGSGDDRWVDAQLARRGYIIRWRMEPHTATNESRPGIRITLGLRESNEATEYLWYALQFTPSRAPELLVTRATLGDMRTLTNITWTPLRSLRIDGMDAELAQTLDTYREEPRPASLMHGLRVIVLGGRLLIDLEGLQAPLVIPLVRPPAFSDYAEDPSSPLPPYQPTPIPPDRLIEVVHIRWWRWRSIMLALSPMWFDAVGEIEGGEQQVGFVPTSEPDTKEVRYAVPKPTDTDANVTIEDIPTLRYKLTLRHTNATQQRPVGNRTVAPDTPIVRGVDFGFNPTPQRDLSEPSLTQPQEITVAWQFDIARLQIRSQAQLVYLDPDGYWANWNQQVGQRAIRIRLARYAHDVVGGVDVQLPPPKTIPLTTVFTGYMHRSGTVSTGQGGVQQFVVQCVDRVAQLEQPRWWLAWMDGWNSYYAMAYLAGLGGIATNDLLFAGLVPSTPYDEVPAPEPAWFLPVGAAGTPLTRFTGVPLWEVMGRIAKTIGFLLYFNQHGKLAFHKFRGLETPPTDDFVYTEQESTVSLQRDLGDVRNTVTIIGVDAYAPLQLPIVSHRIDTASMNDPTAPNYIGYPQPFVWADSQFARLEFARAAADTIFQLFRQPNETITMRVPLTPNLFPGAGVRFISRNNRFGINNKRYLVTSVQHRVWGGSHGETTLTARYFGDAVV